jgi:hypothetical protein
MLNPFVGSIDLIYRREICLTDRVLARYAVVAWVELALYAACLDCRGEIGGSGPDNTLAASRL